MPDNVPGSSLAEEGYGGWERLLRYSQAAVFVCTAADRFAPTYASPNIIDILGLSGAEVVSRLSIWEDGIQGEHRSLRLEGLRGAAGGQPHVGEYRFARPDGRQIWIRETLHPDPDHDGVVRRVVGSLIDITDSRRARAEFAETESRFRAAFETAGLPSALVGEDGCIIESNQAMAAWLGYTVEEMRGMAICDISHPGEVAENQRLRDQLWSGQADRFRMEKRYIRKDGTVLWGLLHNAIVRDAERRPLYTIGQVQDITEQRRSQAAAREAHDRLKDAIAAMPDGFALFDADERLVLCNEGYRRLPAVDPACVPGTHIEDILNADSRSELAPGGGKRAEESRHERLRSFRAARGVSSLAVTGGRWLRLAEQRTRDGGTVVVASDVTDLTRAEVALRDSEERFRHLVEGSALGILVTRHRRILYANTRLAEILGYGGASEILAVETSDKLQAPHEVERLEAFREARLRGAPVSNCYEYEALRKDGRTLWVENRIAVIMWRGEPAALSSIVDIDDRKRVEAALRQSEVLFRGSFEHSPFPAAVADEGGCYRHVNRALSELVGYSEAELIGRPAGMLTHPDERGDARARIAECLEEALPSYRVRKRYRHKNGRIIWVIASVSLLRDEAGQVFGSIRQVQDITEEVNADKARRDVESRLYAVIHHSPAGICIRDPDGRVLLVNEAYAGRFGMTAEELTGRYIGDVYPAEYTHELREADALVMKTGRPITGERTRRFSDGRMHTLLSVKFAVVDAEGRPYGVGIISNDITEYKNVEERLHHAQRMEMVGQLTGGIAHDFNNLLNVILGNLELIDAAAGHNPEVARRIMSADVAVHRGAELTDRLLAFSRRKSLRPQLIDVNRLVQGMVELLSRTLGENIKLETVLAPGLPRARIDPGQLENAILNLALNSRDAVAAGGRLIIETQAHVGVSLPVDSTEDLPPGLYVSLTLSDNGVGMLPEVRDRAFEPFFTTKEVGKGSGLGLSMVYGFVKQSGGHVEIDTRPGEGTRIRMLLPGIQAAENAQSLDVPLGEVPRGQGETILVVEDDQELRRVAFEMLSDLGYRVLTAEDGPSALAIVAGEDRIDVLFSDMVLPRGMNGAELARRARVRRPDIKVVLTSGYPEEMLRRYGAADDGQLRVGKPYRLAQVARTLRDALDDRQLSFALPSADGRLP